MSIARCVYSRPNVAVFNGLLSALDVSTARRVFEKIFCTQGPPNCDC